MSNTVTTAYRHTPRTRDNYLINTNSNALIRANNTSLVRGNRTSGNSELIDPSLFDESLISPKNIFILLVVIIFLLILLFLGMRNIQNQITSKINGLDQQIKQLIKSQELIFKNQQNQLEMVQTNSIRNDELRNNITRDFKNSLIQYLHSQPVQILQSPPPQIITSPPPQIVHQNPQVMQLQNTGKPTNFNQGEMGTYDQTYPRKIQPNYNYKDDAGLPRLGMAPRAGSSGNGRPQYIA